MTGAVLLPDTVAKEQAPASGRIVKAQGADARGERGTRIVDGGVFSDAFGRNGPNLEGNELSRRVVILPD